MTYDNSSKEIVFSDDEAASDSLVGKFLQISVRLVDVNGQESQYIMNVQVITNQEESQASV